MEARNIVMFSFIMQGVQSIFGGVFGASAKRAMAKQVMANAAYQSGQYMMAAERAGSEGAMAQYALRQQQEQRLAQLEGAYAASGVSLEGTATDMLAAQAGADRANIEALQYQTRAQVGDYVTAAQNAILEGRSQAAALKRAARQDLIGGFFGAGAKATDYLTQNTGNYTTSNIRNEDGSYSVKTTYEKNWNKLFN